MKNSLIKHRLENKSHAEHPAIDAASHGPREEQTRFCISDLMRFCRGPHVASLCSFFPRGPCLDLGIFSRLLFHFVFSCKGASAAVPIPYTSETMEVHGGGGSIRFNSVSNGIQSLQRSSFSSPEFLSSECSSR